MTHMRVIGTVRRTGLWLVLCALFMVGCSSTRNKAPVEQRVAVAPAGAATAPTPAPTPVMPPAELPGAENAGKPGYYTVKPGDTLRKVAEVSGQNWRDIARWNNLDNPNVVEVGQVLRVVPPVIEPEAVAVRPVPGAGRVETKPLDAKPSAPPVASAPSAPAAAGAATAATAATAPAAPAAGTALARETDDDVVWVWPASGAVVAGFDEGRNKGLTIIGVAGDPVLAAADGRVVYAGSSLRGYGNLVIVKHNETYLTAYAHNQVLLVKDDQVVRRGQRIAEMGSTDAQRVQLHFEIRRQGKPIDPAKLLPPR